MRRLTDNKTSILKYNVVKVPAHIFKSLSRNNFRIADCIQRELVFKKNSLCCAYPICPRDLAFEHACTRQTTAESYRTDNSETQVLCRITVIPIIQGRCPSSQ